MTFPNMTVPGPYSYQVRAELRKIPTWKLLEVYESLTSGMETGIAIVEQNRAQATSAIREVLFERGKAPSEDTVGVRVLKTLVSQTINDITMDQMNRIVRRLNRMRQTDRGIPKRVADVLADELGPPKAIQYIDKALAAGQIKMREYEEMRAALLLPLPREEIPRPIVARAVRELLAGQEELKGDFRRLSEAGKETFRKPIEALDADVKRIRRSWGL